MEQLEGAAAAILRTTKARTVMILARWSDDEKHVTAVAPETGRAEVFSTAMDSIGAALNLMRKIIADDKVEEAQEKEQQGG